MKGRTYETFADLPKAAQERFYRIAGGDLARANVELTPEAIHAAAEALAAPAIAAFNERWEVVAHCSVEDCGKPLIAGEYVDHFLNAHFPARLRHLARELAAISPADRTQVIGLFGFDGAFVGADE